MLVAASLAWGEAAAATSPAIARDCTTTKPEVRVGLGFAIPPLIMTDASHLVPVAEPHNVADTDTTSVLEQQTSDSSTTEDIHEEEAPSQGGERIFHAELDTGFWSWVQRTADTLWLGGKLHFSALSLESELAGQSLDEAEVRKLWDALHRQNASLVVQHIMRYRGLFVKVGQQASTMKGVLPDPWIEALAPLQDSLPISSFSSVHQTIFEEFGQPLENIFCDFQPNPIASASIGQAHVAHLLSGNTKVCVKVQHHGIAELFCGDLNNLEYLYTWFKYHDGCPDFQEPINEMRRSSIEEFDFRNEAQNSIDARAAIARSGLNIGCPEPLMQYCRPSVLTMRFIEGCKITQTDRLPLGVDMQALMSTLVEAFAMLMFEAGLVHGDPHPGNIFVEQTGEGPDSIRPVLLDWGIVRRLSPEERTKLAKWVVASLSRDRIFHFASLIMLGHKFPEWVGEDHETLEKLLFQSMFHLRDTLPASSRQQWEREATMKEKEAADGRTKREVMSKASGWTCFVFRGLWMLQDTVGGLELSVNLARPMLKYALWWLGAENIHRSLRPRGAASARGALEAAVMLKFEELRALGLLLGAQVAVLGDGDEWRCDVTSGRLGWVAGPVAPSGDVTNAVAGGGDASLLPLLDISTTVLLLCFLGAITRKTANGEDINFDTPVGQLWPEFACGGKATVTIWQLLQHQGGLAKPFQSQTDFNVICSERRMEETLASAPFSSGGAAPCRVLGVALAALLRRATGHESVTEALKTSLSPLGLEEDIVYSGAEERMAHVGHQLLEEVGISSLWEKFDEVMSRGNVNEENVGPWLSWQEFAQRQPWCVDPTFVNSEALRMAKGCASGRGLRASSRALCTLLSSNIASPAVLGSSLSQAAPLKVQSLEEWRSLGCCLDVGVGWQLFRFERTGSSNSNAGEVLGFGHIDGATGSIALRLPGASVSVLLTQVDPDARQQAGRKLLDVITEHLGLRPLFGDRPPPNLLEHASVQKGIALGKIGKEQLSRTMAHFGEDLAGLGELSHPQPVLEATPFGCTSAHTIAGHWHSNASRQAPQGFEELLEALDAPTAVRSLAKRLRWTLDIQVIGDRIRFHSVTTLGAWQVEENTMDFKMGIPFEGEQFGTKYQGTASWEAQQQVGKRKVNNHRASQDGNVCFAGASLLACSCEGWAVSTQRRWTREEKNDQKKHTLVIEKHFKVAGQEVKFIERFELLSDDNLTVKFTLRRKGTLSVTLQTLEEAKVLAHVLNPQTLRLKRGLHLGGQQLSRGGYVSFAKVASGAWEAKDCMVSIIDPPRLRLPAVVQLRYDDINGATEYVRRGR